MILIDSDTIMTAAGPEGARKAACAATIERVASGEIEAALDSHSLIEILRHYRELKRPDDGRRVFDLTRQIFPDVLPVTAATVDRARRILDSDPRLAVRHALHAAVVISEGMEAICSFDRSYDRIMGLVRQEPRA